MTNKQFFQEALLEAKAIRETALVAAKEALEEAFTPKIKSMIDAKLSLMEDDASDDNEDSSMDEYGCRNSMKDNEAFCAECCADTTDGMCCG